MGADLLADLRWLADGAHSDAGEAALLERLRAAVAALWDGGEDGDDARRRVPVYARTTLVGVVEVHDALADDPRVAALIAATSAALTARQAIRETRVDALTQMLSRSAMEATLDEEVQRAAREGRRLSVVMLDLDDFKAVNDDLGHSAGDEVLREVGVALRGRVRPYDHIARMGGDEFLVIVPGAATPTVVRAARRLRATVATRISAVSGRPVGCSAGVAHWHAGCTAEELLDAADAALRSAKRQGRGRVVESARDSTVRVVDEPPPEVVSGDLVTALRGEGLHPVFQPICDLADGRTVAYEALSRGPGRLERPDRMLSHARAAGRLVDLDEQLRRTAFSAATAAGLRSPLILFFNVERETLLATVDDPTVWRRDEQGFPSVTEITERMLFAHPGRLLQACERLRTMGWGVALDDVGQDPRALSLLPLIAPDVVKLDLRLLRDRPAADLATVTVATSAQAERTGMEILAEGIETHGHLETARTLGATLGQGWMFGRPGPLDPVAALEPQAPPVRHSPPAHGPRGTTPFALIAGTAPVRSADVSLLAELQATFERRALGTGLLATLTTALPAPDLDPGAERRLRHLARDVGFTALIAPGAETRDDRGFMSLPMDDAPPTNGDWVTVVTAPHFALGFAARRTPGTQDRWSFAVTQDPDVGLLVAQWLLMALANAD